MKSAWKTKCLAACLLAGSTVPLAAAPVQWLSGGGGNDHWYELVSSQVSWTTANTNANASSFMGLAGHLVTITSAAENAFVNGVMGPNLAWIGLTDQVTEGTFAWVTGEPVSYTNWNPGEPNNGGGTEDYAEMISPSGRWNDISNTNGGGRFYLVEFEAGVPEPATVALLGLGLLGLGLRRRIVR